MQGQVGSVHHSEEINVHYAAPLLCVGIGDQLKGRIADSYTQEEQTPFPLAIAGLKQ
jgi:hypothetical protein